LTHIKSPFSAIRYAPCMNRPRRPSSVLALTGAGEPFRLLCPLGVLLGGVGIGLWPAFALGWPEMYPGIPHARIMMQGFMSAFVFGFLGTALPRMLEVPRLRLTATVLLGAGLLLSSILHLLSQTVAGDAVFLLTFLAFGGVLMARFKHRKDTPPPGFVLVLGGLVSTILGHAILLVDGVTAEPLAGSLVHLGKLLAWQAYLLFPVMGIGAFLLPRFFGLPNRHDFPERLMPSPEWWRRAAFAFACGTVVMVGFVLEAAGSPEIGFALRVIGVTIYLIREVPVHRARGARGSLALALKLSLASLPVGYLLMAVFPSWRLTLIHIVFITGFGLITMTVASRVVLGHSGRSDRFKATSPAVLLLTGGFFAAMLARVGGDLLMPELRFQFYGLAGLLWLGGALAWCIGILPGVRYPDDE
jgi:uncharacterized protein involved in response to NO